MDGPVTAPVSAAPARIRVVVLQAGSTGFDPADLFDWRMQGARSVRRREWVGTDPLPRRGFGIDLVEVPVCRSRQSACDLSTDRGGSRGANLRRQRPLAKHLLDVALSRGRHAAERAKLAGIEALIATTHRVVQPERVERMATPRAGGRRSNPTANDGVVLVRGLDPYEALAAERCPAIAGLVGLIIAAAQIGIPIGLVGRDCDRAERYARCLHAGCGAWIDRLPSDFAADGTTDRAAPEASPPRHSFA